MSDPVTLRFPATSERVRLARVLVATLADEAGFDYDDVEDLRIAVDELCFLLLDAGAPGAELELVARSAPGDLQVEGRVTASIHSPPAPSELSTQILGTVVDAYDLHLDGGEPRFSFRKSKT